MYCNEANIFNLSRGPDRGRDQIWGGAANRSQCLKTERAIRWAKVSLPVRGAVDRRACNYSEIDRRRLASRLRHLRRHAGVILSWGPQERRNPGTRV